MSSILTNNSAMVALQTLQSVNSNLAKTQDMISTGKQVSSAKDNAAVFAISKVMESDVKGFKAISDSLALGESTVAVGRQAAETVTDLLTDMKGKIVAAQEQNVDRDKIQTDIDALTKQIGSVVGAAQFNGLNLVDGSSDESMNVLSSLDRDASGNVTPGEIEVVRQNLSVTGPVAAQTFGVGAGDDTLVTGSAGTSVALADGDTSTINGSDEATVTNSNDVTLTVASVSDGDSFRVDLGGLSVNTADGGVATGVERGFKYVASASDGTNDVATNLVNQMNAFFAAATDASLDYSAEVVTSGNDTQIVITNGDSGTTNDDMLVGFGGANGGTPGSSVASGGLEALQTIDVTSNTGASSALTAIEGLIQKSVDAAAAFGSVEGRISTQSDFVSKLTDSLTSGIGSLVDANMEETSARLQALQVQQQLATQSLSIANQAPQALLSLFR